MPIEDLFVLDLAGHGFDEGVFHPFGDVYNRFFFGEGPQENTVF